MSAKWVRSQEWDRQHLTGALTPIRWVLHAMSTISLAVCLLIAVAVYGVLASVPIGLIALAPTYLLYGLSLVVTAALIAGLPVWLLWRAGVKRGWGFGTRFTLSLVAGILLTLGAVWAWYTVGWPVLRYDETTGHGLRLFADFVDRYKAVSVRRTPALEMTELEFYGWWPLKLLLLAFVLNMVVATARRIEFNVPNLGVLTVHTGIVVLGLGAAAYAAAKQEGDVLLLAGPPDPSDKSGSPTLGPMETGFFDNTRVVLRARQKRTEQEKIDLKLPPDIEWEQRALVGLPRYNDYNLGAVASLTSVLRGDDRGRTISVAVPDSPGLKVVDSDIRFRVVGYAAAAELKPSWSEVKGVPGGPPPPDRPVRYVDLMTSLDSDMQPRADGKPRVMQSMGFMPTVPAERLVELARALRIEYLRNASEDRWAKLTADIPLPSDPSKQPVGGLIVEVPGQNVSRLYPVEPGSTISVGGYTIEFTSLSARPPFPIITPGYERASSSVAIVRVTPPGEGAKAYDRYLYTRFPEIAQDLSATELNARGMPVRTAAAKDITLTFIDATVVNVVMDERPDGTVRGFVRLPMPKGIAVMRFDGLKEGDSLPIGPQLSVRLGKTVPSVEAVNVPESVVGPERERDLGTHKQAAIAVEISSAGAPGRAQPFAKTVWLPFQMYTNARVGGEATAVDLPDGRTVEVAFGRLWRPLPGMGLRLADFEMMPYPHSTQPQDFRSELLVTKFDHAGNAVATERRATSLNEPLLESPFVWDRGRNALANGAAWLASVLGDTRFKFSQSGWDNAGWTETRSRADAGELKRAYGRFTILGVGNNPGIKIIALGAILTCTGIPWAFYVKPIIIRRRKAALARAAAEGKLPPRGPGSGRTARPSLAPSTMEVEP
ncbi:MAG: hypothetical protein K2Q09_09665 [Phycisphaerales bacterium]|nr:hypothetical protein [Phycisphaerales bacterium]